MGDGLSILESEGIGSNLVTGVLSVLCLFIGKCHFVGVQSTSVRVEAVVRDWVLGVAARVTVTRGDSGSGDGR